MSWIGLILQLLKLANYITDLAMQRKYITQGAAEEIARSASAIAAKVEVAKHVEETVTGLDDSSIDDLLRGLEPKSPEPADPKRQLLSDLPESGEGSRGWIDQGDDLRSPPDRNKRS